ncbi:hypothetical protein MBLNU459_g1770t1 [Dothideomycetes sp. NU459]
MPHWARPWQRVRQKPAGPLQPNDLPSASSFLDGDTSLGRLSKPTNELSLRCTEFDGNGNVTLVNGAFKKSELIAKYGLLPRDLRKIDSSSLPHILVRPSAILINILHVRCLIKHNRVLVFDAYGTTDSHTQSLFMYDLEGKLQSREGRTAGALPYEFRALEAVLISVTAGLEGEFEGVREPVVKVLRELEEDIDRDKLRHLLIYSKKLGTFEQKARLVRDAIDDLLEADDDLASMYLTEKASGKERPEDDHTEVEMLLESYHKVCDEIVQVSGNLVSNIRNTEEIVKAILDANRNSLMLLDLRFTILTLGIGVGTFFAGLYGMNLKNFIEESDFGFPLVSVSCGVFAAVAVVYGLRKLRKVQRLSMWGEGGSLNQGAQNVKGRIKHLEQLVVELMHSRGNPIDSTGTSQPSQGPTDTSPDNNELGSGSRQVSTELTPPSSGEEADPNYSRQDADSELGAFGQLKISKSQTTYVGEGHWASILNSISDLKRDFDDGEDEDGDLAEWQQDDKPSELATGPPNLSGLLRAPKRITRTELLESIPPKHVVDPLVAAFWNSPDPFKPVLHGPQFQNEYRQFWREPKKAPVMWLSLLLAVMSLGSSAKLRPESDYASVTAQAAIAEANKYHELAAAAAVLADYTTPKAYTVEALILYAGAFRSLNAFFDVWLLMGVVLRLALRMGYHRDGDHYNLSPYSAEMRRRAWACLYMADVLISWQLGLPGLIRAVQSDTKPPHNLLDRDFGLQTKVLPPSRPFEECTPSAYGAVKLQFCRVFADAADLSHVTTPPSYSEVMELDERLTSARSEIPPLLKLSDTSITLTPEHLMCSYNLEMLHAKARIILHRRFMTKEQGHEYSRWASSQPGGQLEPVSWYMGSIGTYDFLLAAMIICLELSQQCAPQGDTSGTEDAGMRQKMIEALETSKNIWEEARSLSVGALAPALSVETHKMTTVLSETTKACEAMSKMLTMVKARYPDSGSPATAGEHISQSMNDAAASVPLEPGTATTNHNGTPNDSALNDFLMIDDMIGSNNVDWEMWDQQLSREQNPNAFPEWTFDDLMADTLAPGMDFTQSAGMDPSGLQATDPWDI